MIRFVLLSFSICMASTMPSSSSNLLHTCIRISLFFVTRKCQLNANAKQLDIENQRATLYFLFAFCCFIFRKRKKCLKQEKKQQQQQRAVRRIQPGWCCLKWGDWHDEWNKRQSKHLNIQTHKVPFLIGLFFTHSPIHSLPPSRKQALHCLLISKNQYWLLIFFEKIFKKNIYPKSMIKSLLKWIVCTIHNAGRMFAQWMCLNLG